jgi:hypothetical protein
VAAIPTDTAMAMEADTVEVMAAVVVMAEVAVTEVVVVVVVTGCPIWVPV